MLLFYYIEEITLKIIHCADIHLGSKLEANLEGDARKLRKAELLDSYSNMVDYAVHHKVDAIIIAGDLFDTARVSATILNVVRQSIINNPQIDFYYLKGNHDTEDCLALESEECHNLHLFKDSWTSYFLGEKEKINLCGVELNSDNNSTIYNSLILEPGQFNIVVMHGQNANSASKDKTEIINLNALKNKSIDYLALGHIHSYLEGELDLRGTYCYPGCLEGRGFDECGQHGFIMLDIDEDSLEFTRKWVNWGTRQLYECFADVSECDDTYSCLNTVKSALNNTEADTKDLVKVVLTGEISAETEFDTEYIRHELSSNYFFIKVNDKTRIKADINKYMKDVSLKGEFIRMVLKDESLDEDTKSEIIKTGLAALKGEEF